MPRPSEIKRAARAWRQAGKPASGAAFNNYRGIMLEAAEDSRFEGAFTRMRKAREKPPLDVQDVEEMCLRFERSTDGAQARSLAKLRQLDRFYGTDYSDPGGLFWSGLLTEVAQAAGQAEARSDEFVEFVFNPVFAQQALPAPPKQQSGAPGLRGKARSGKGPNPGETFGPYDPGNPAGVPGESKGEKYAHLKSLGWKRAKIARFFYLRSNSSVSASIKSFLEKQAKTGA